MNPASANATERTPLLEADHGANGEGNSRPRRTSRCALHTDNCFLSDGSSKNNAEHRQVQRKLLVACILCVLFMIVEVVGGYMAHSIAILSDAAHMLSDVAGFAVSLFAAWAVTRKSHAAYSFGYHRIEILGALVSVLTIWAVTGALLFEAVLRVMYPEPVDGKLMFLVACAGIAFNLVIAAVLGEHHVHGVGGHDHHHDHDHHDHHGHAHGHTHSHTDTSPESRSHRHSHEGEGSTGSGSEDDERQAHERRGHLSGGSCCVITVPLPRSSGNGISSPGTAAAANGSALSAVFRQDDHEVAVRGGVRALAGVQQPSAAAGTLQGQQQEQAAGGEQSDSSSDDDRDSNGHSHGHAHGHGHGHCHGHGKHGSGGAGGVQQGGGVAASVSAEVVCEGAANPGASASGSSHSHSHSEEESEAHPGANGHGHVHDHHDGHGHGDGHKHVHKGAAHKHKHEGVQVQPHGHGHGHGHKHGGHGCKHGHEHHHEHRQHGEVRALHAHGPGHGHGHEHCHGHEHSHSGHGHGHSHHGHSHGGNINLRSAVLHVVGDLLQSIGVAAAGALIWWHQDDPRWQIADPLCTFLFAGLVMWTTRGIIADIMHTLMERSPQHFNLEELTNAMTQMEGIMDVHDLHVWNLSMGLPILTAHVHIAESADADTVLRGLESYVQQTLGIQHSTIQICKYQGAAVAVTDAGGVREREGTGCALRQAGDTLV